MRAVVDTEPRSLEKARAWRDSVGAPNLVHCTGGARVAWQPARSGVRRLPAEQLVGRLAGSYGGASR